jgi:hypothetical protein
MSDIQAFSWESLLNSAECIWRDFIDILGERAPDDKRLRGLIVVEESCAG